MDKRKYMKPTCEAVKVNTSQSLLTLVSLSSLSTTTYDATPGGSLVGKKRNDIAAQGEFSVDSPRATNQIS